VGKRASNVPKLRLPEILDLTAAAPLAAALLARRGGGLVVDAGGVRRIGASCVQVLLSAALTWKADAAALRVVDPSPELLDALRLLGVAPAELRIEGAVA
jgi:chemotaxis protein CheX